MGGFSSRCRSWQNFAAFLGDRGVRKERAMWIPTAPKHRPTRGGSSDCTSLFCIYSCSNCCVVVLLLFLNLFFLRTAGVQDQRPASAIPLLFCVYSGLQIISINRRNPRTRTSYSRKQAQSTHRLPHANHVQSQPANSGIVPSASGSDCTSTASRRPDGTPEVGANRNWTMPIDTAPILACALNHTALSTFRVRHPGSLARQASCNARTHTPPLVVLDTLFRVIHVLASTQKTEMKNRTDFMTPHTRSMNILCGRR